MEPDAIKLFNERKLSIHDTEIVAMISTAISLRRIADALTECPSDRSSLLQTLLSIDTALANVPR